MTLATRSDYVVGELCYTMFDVKYHLLVLQPAKLRLLELEVLSYQDRQGCDSYSKHSTLTTSLAFRFTSRICHASSPCFRQRL